MTIPTLAELTAKGEQPEILFWVGCAGSFDDRAKRVTVAFTKILNAAAIKFAVLGNETDASDRKVLVPGSWFLVLVPTDLQLATHTQPNP